MSRKAALSPGRLALALAVCLLVFTVGAGPALSANRAPDKLSSVTPTAHETGTVSFSWLASLAAAAASELSATKDANPSYARTFEWEIVKSVDQPGQTIPAGGSATFNYTITVTHDEGTDSDWQVSGQITVTNPNTAVVTGVTVTDAIDDPNATCAVSGGSSTVPASGAIAFDYVCTYSAAPASPSQTNTATISWPAQTLANSASLSAGSITAEAAVLWGDPTAILNGDVDVLDTLAGRLASVSYADPSTQTFTYPLTFEDDPVGTCTEHDNRARVRNDATTIASSATVTVQVCSGGSDLTVTKTAIPSFTRTFGWEVEKSVDQTGRRIPAGDNAAFNYTVDVTKGPAVDSDWAIAGAITVSNSNGFDMNADLADTAPGGSCSLEQTSVRVPANGSVSVGYSCTFPDGAAGQNTATASWDSAAHSTPSGSASGTAGYVFETPTNRVNNSVDVFDNGNLLGATDHSTQFTYAKSFPGIAGTCTSYDNTATVKSNATLLASDTVTVEVCVSGDLTVTKTATPSFTRTFGWEVEKSVDQTSRRIPAGGTATFNYTVDVSKGAAVDSGWALSGAISVHNSNDWDINADLADTAPGGSCSLEQASVTVPANGSVSVGYTCTFASGASGQNTATASWDSAAYSTPTGSASGSAGYAFTAPTQLVDDSVDVFDNGNLLGTTDHSTQFTYPKSFPGVAGTCTDYDNTATVRNQTTLLASDTVTVEVCVSGDLTVTKTAIPSFTRRFGWEVAKSVDQTGRRIPAGDTATFNYTVDVSKGAAVDSGWALSGAISVHNSNDWDINADLADTAPGGSCSLEQASVTVPANGSVSVGYSCAFSDGAAGQNTATASWDSAAYSTPTGSASGSAGYAFTAPTQLVDDSVDVFDNGNLLGTTDHSTQFTYPKSFPGVAGTCTDYDNTATVRNQTTLLASDTVTVEVCAGQNLAVQTTATPPSFTRTYKWKITKSVAAPSTVTQSGGTASFNYTVNATGDGYSDAGWVVTGKITVTNPNDWEQISANVTDSVDNGGTCTVTDGTGITIPAHSSVTLDYSCTYTTAPSPAAGLNTATATWNNATFSTPHGATTGTAGFTFNTPTTELEKTVTVTDTFNNTTNTLGSVTYPGPRTFSYTRTVNVPTAGTCLTYPNTAKLTETGQTATASVTVCGSTLTISGTKWNDLNNNHIAGDAGDVVLPGWTIRIYDAQNLLLDSAVTGANGLFAFAESPGTYKLCEVSQSGWVQTAPVAGTATCNGPNEAGQGHSITVSSADSTGNNFGNTTSSVADCKEDPDKAALMTRVVDTSGKTHGPAPVYSTVQAAYNAAANTGEVIGVFTPTTENIVLGGAKVLTITECGAAKQTAADQSKPVWDVKSTGKLTIIGPTTYGGTIGWLVESNGNDLKSVRAYNASQLGVHIKSSSNGVSFNSVSGSPVGVQIDGNSNDVRSGTISGNSTGVVIAGGSNSLSGATIGPNTKDGVVVNGPNNTVKGNSASGNGWDGFRVTGTGTMLDSNKAYKNTGCGFAVAASATGTKLKSNASNTGNSGSSNENAGYEYKFGVAVTNQGSNKKDNVGFTITAAGSYE